tara:strand:- start:381 stop:740 length:360 start_codon:yes stop_codon:yes gene_type:complete
MKNKLTCKEIDLLYFIVQRYIGKCNKVRFDLSELTPKQQEDFKVELDLLKKLEKLQKMKNKFHWNEDTIKHFASIEFNERLNKMFDFVKYECDLEEGESVQDLYNDLNRQVLEYNNLQK